MYFQADKAYDIALDYLSKRTEPAQMPAVSALLDQAADLYEDGELDQFRAQQLLQKVLLLVRPENRAEIEQLIASKHRLISTYLPK